jgi:hypothetical protein
MARALQRGGLEPDQHHRGFIRRGIDALLAGGSFGLAVAGSDEFIATGLSTNWVTLPGSDLVTSTNIAHQSKQSRGFLPDGLSVTPAW